MTSNRTEANERLFISLNEQISSCALCPRLVEWRERVAIEKRKSFADWTYWGKGVPIFGDPQAERMIVGLAPAAHGANRTGRMFTGDKSGDWLYRALYDAGVANQAHSERIDDGLTLTGALICAAAHCAPPDNKPETSEIASCSRYLTAMLGSRRWRSILCLGGVAWVHVLKLLGEARQPFSHGVSHRTESGTLLVGSYHPSQQNTFTGRLTREMLNEAVARWLEK